MARVLVVGCGCRGCSLARALKDRGHAVRGTTRDPGRAALIEACGAEPVVADPDRVATLTGALEAVGVVCLLLGSADGSPEALAALHGSRLEMLLERMVDTTVRGVMYEASGSVDEALLRAGAELVRAGCERSRIPCAVVTADPGSHEPWRGAALDAVERLLKTT